MRVANLQIRCVKLLAVHSTGGSVLNTESLQLPSLSDLHVLVVGDVMLDRYWQGPADRVSPEAPVPVVNVQHQEQRPGGAANVALNVVSLGARCTLIGLVGEDEAAQDLQDTLEAAGVVCDFIRVPQWPTIVKLRLLAQKQQLVRADFEQALPGTDAVERQAQIQNKVEKHLIGADICVLEDYDKGVLEDPQALIYAARQAKVPVLVDPKMKPLSVYANATVIKPNAREFQHALDMEQISSPARASKLANKSASKDDIRGQALCAKLGLSGLVVTRGEQGIDVHSIDAVQHIPARSVEVYDVTGAGDTTAATLAIGLGLGWPLLNCARIANVAASIAVSKSGTSAVTGPELHQTMQNSAPDRGLMSRQDLALAVKQAKANGQRVVFTNGCFDILHAGHVTYLAEAAALGDRLIVAINDDVSVSQLKGPGRPVVPVEGRSRVLAGLGCVDWVVSFDEDTPEPLLKLLQPDVLVKGGDYSADQVVGAALVEAYGGEVKVLSLVDDVSTTTIVARILASQPPSG